MTNRPWSGAGLGVAGRGLLAFCAFFVILAEPLAAAEGRIIFRNDSGQRLELRSRYGEWHSMPEQAIPVEGSAQADVRFPNGGVVVQSLSYAFADDRKSYCQVRVATVPGPAGCMIELHPVNRKHMDCFARASRRDRQSCAFEVEVDVAPKRP